MKTFIALLRGINVGGNNQIAMSDLRRSFESLGFEHVTTYINSGNVIFMTKLEDIQVLTQEIENQLDIDFNTKLKVILREGSNILNLAHNIPQDWENDTEQKTDILFLGETIDRKETIDLIKVNPEIDSLVYYDGAIIWHIDREHTTKSGLHTFIGTTVYKNMSARNVNTVRKLAKLIEDYERFEEVTIR